MPVSSGWGQYRIRVTDVPEHCGEPAPAERSAALCATTMGSKSMYTTRAPGCAERAASWTFGGVVGIPLPRSMNCLMPRSAMNWTARLPNARLARPWLARPGTRRAAS